MCHRVSKHFIFNRVRFLIRASIFQIAWKVYQHCEEDKVYVSHCLLLRQNADMLGKSVCVRETWKGEVSHCFICMFE